MNANNDIKKELIKEVNKSIDNLFTNTDKVIDFLSFSKRFYNYSPRNIMLMMNQNPYCSYVGSFLHYKNELDCSVKKGEQGLKILTPVTITYFENEDKKIKKLKNATKKEKEKIKRGEYKSWSKQGYRVGNVFDISQTTFPKEEYPKLLQAGYDNAGYKTVFNGLEEFSSSIGVEVEVKKFNSITLRGLYERNTEKTKGKDEKIKINSILKDSEKVSVLSHEIGHALLHNTDNKADKSEYQKEVEADCISFLILDKFNLKFSDTRLYHFKTNLDGLAENLKENKTKDHKEEKIFRDILDDVFKVYKENAGKIERHVILAKSREFKNSISNKKKKEFKTIIKK